MRQPMIVVQDLLLKIKNKFRPEYSQRLCIVFDDMKGLYLRFSHEIEHTITHTIHIKHLITSWLYKEDL